VRHFDFLTEHETAALFAVPPQEFCADASPAVLSIALGATLYSPGTRPTLADDARRAAAIGATSHVWCLEDAIAHDEVPLAQANVVRQLRELHAAADEPVVPLLFVRVRTPEQIVELVSGAGPAADRLTGFVLPKIAPDERGERMMLALIQASEMAGRRLYGLPVLEHADLAWRDTRDGHLTGLRHLFRSYREHILSLRVGGTDLCGLFGLRRDRDTTIWDVAVVRDALGDVLNTFARRGDYVVSAPVWEHFVGPDRLFKPQLRFTPFERGGRLRLRQQLLREDTDELLREVLLDRANGFHGKTAIHPRHVAIINTLHAVSPEEYDDATTVLAARGRGGTVRSLAGNKMNELGPHELWAEQVVARAGVFGVLAQPDSMVELLQRGRTVVDALYPLHPVAAPAAGSGR
jgi:citrate lyase beta subunit